MMKNMDVDVLKKVASDPSGGSVTTHSLVSVADYEVVSDTNPAPLSVPLP